MIQNMERTSDWMWTRRKFNSSSHLQTSSYNDSWEEQAFAEDSAGPLGGCIWPPRSYSCSFCRREFRSAQALGGHMNVHRRDRARLRQSPSSSHNDNHHLLQHNPHQNPCTLLNQYPSEVRALVYPNPNFPSPQSSSRVSILSTTQENSSDKTLVSPQPPPIAFQVLSISRNSLRAQEIDCLGKGDSSKLESAVSSSNLVSRKRQIEASKDEEAISFKRMRNNVSFPFFIRPTAPIEDLDLELRLGDRPKVK